MRLGEMLRKRGLLTPAQLEQALAARQPGGERLGAALVRLGLVPEPEVYRALAEQAGIGFTDLAGLQLSEELLESVPVKVVFGRKILPLAQQNGALTVAVSDPLDFGLVDELKVLLRKNVVAVAAPPSEIEKLIRGYYGVGADEMARMLTAAGDELELVRNGEGAEADVEQMAEDASLIKFVNQLLIEAVRERASDVHIEPMEHELRVRYRIDGVLHNMPVPSAIKHFQPAIVSRLKIMSALNIAEKRLPQDGRIKIKVLGREIDLRVSVIPNIHGEGVVLRILDRTAVLLDLEQLGMAADTLELWNRLIHQPHGILLVTGPTGSGKTTTLYAALKRINNIEDKIITVEDPVEYQMEGIKQIQVHPKIGLTFAAGMRSILRHDPDIILIGEIRDLETAQIAVQASLTGHLVLSTLHTNDAPSAVTRLIDMGVEPYLVSSTVEGLMAQRLVRRICAACKTRAPVTPVQRPLVPEDLKEGSFGKGCAECHGTGYRGRTGLFELARVSDEIREMIVRRDPANLIKRRAVKEGMRTLRQEGWMRVGQGLTTIDELLRITKED
jgi:general secretion pathway protein E/type IV pilus assembly protein PilB